MKKIFGFLALFILFGCDDGDMTFQSFNFSGELDSCDNVEAGTTKIYSVNDSEALILKLASSNFVNVPTNGVPRIVTIGASGTNTVQYIQYSSDIESNSDNVICEPQSPVVATETWIANGGTIEIITNPIPDEDNPSIATGYTHTIRIISLSFTRNDETIIIEDNELGDYQTPLGYTFNFNNDNVTLQTCQEDPEILYIIDQKAVLKMELNNAVLFQNNITPQQQVIDENNHIVLNIYEGGSVSSAVACGGQVVGTSLKAVWEAYEGTIEVTTTELTPGVFSHQIKFMNMSFRNTANTNEVFTRTNYILGDTFDE